VALVYWGATLRDQARDVSFEARSGHSVGDRRVVAIANVSPTLQAAPKAKDCRHDCFRRILLHEMFCVGHSMEESAWNTVRELAAVL
jgi:hypothetical protein